MNLAGLVAVNTAFAEPTSMTKWFDYRDIEVPKLRQILPHLSPSDQHL